MVRKAFLLTAALFYTIGGINHFVHPQFYIPLIPPYLVFVDELNVLSGLAEILLAIGLLFTKTRKLASIGIIAMLVAFIPSHVYFIQIGSCVENGLCVPAWIAWVRLVAVHPLLVWWAYAIRD
jgi:uncharacterized membrane protein